MGSRIPMPVIRNSVHATRTGRNPYLRLDEQSGRKVVCSRCRSSGGLPQQFPFPRGTWQQPWVHEAPADLDEGEPAWLLELNDVRVHTPVNLTALVIPPESRIRRGTVVDRLYGNTRNQQRIRNGRTSPGTQDRDQAGLQRVQLHG